MHHPPLRPGETATLFRFWLARDEYQGGLPAQSLIATQFARHFLTTPGLAVTLMPFAHPENWAAFCAYADQRRAPAADFTVGGRPYATFVHDWRVVSPAAWVARLSQQELGARRPRPSRPPPPELWCSTRRRSPRRFARRCATIRPDRLRDNPLLRCRLVTSRLTGTEAGRAGFAAQERA